MTIDYCGANSAHLYRIVTHGYFSHSQRGTIGHWARTSINRSYFLVVALEIGTELRIIKNTDVADVFAISVRPESVAVDDVSEVQVPWTRHITTPRSTTHLSSTIWSLCSSPPHDTVVSSKCTGLDNKKVAKTARFPTIGCRDSLNDQLDIKTGTPISTGFCWPRRIEWVTLLYCAKLSSDHKMTWNHGLYRQYYFWRLAYLFTTMFRFNLNLR